MRKTVELLNFKSKNKLPVIIQTEVAECGLASMAMIANFYGHKVDLNSLRHMFAISTKGATLAGLIKLADCLQFSSRPVRLELDDLQNLKMPTILHWNMNHFVVLKSVKGNKITIHDPAVGLRVFTFEEFSNHFTGVALELTPSPEFKAKKLINKVKLSEFWSRISGIKRVLIQIFILSMIIQIFAIASPFYMQLVVDDVIINRDYDLLMILAIGFGFLSLVSIFVTTIRSLVILYMNSQLSIQISANIFRHLLKLPMDFYMKRHIGDVISRFRSLENIKELLTTGLIETSVDGILAIGLFVMIVIYSPILALIVIVTVLVYLAIRLALYNTFRMLNEELIVKGAKEQTNFMETVRAIQSIKLFGNETQRQAVWLNHYADTMNSSIKVSKLTIHYNVINTVLFGIGDILVIYLAATQVIDNLMSIGMLFAFMSYKMRFTSTAYALIEKFIQFKMLSLHLERLGDIVLTEQEKDLQGNIVFDKEEQIELSLQNISFRYSQSEPYILKDLNLTIKKGQSVAIVGSSGCGKSTLMKVMLGLLQPDTGEVLINNSDITKIGLSTYRSMIATVMQDDQLLSGSISDNICFFDPNFDLKRIQECAKQAAIDTDIAAMPMGYHTLIGDMGNSLSGGQKQRILLARALYKKPKILFLDEATSSLDTKLEKRVNETIKKINITRIFIAHRAETIAMADSVLTLEDGQITES